ncbi:hypothetical protein M9H77_29643 [Catharanthus roseus]|uniref:Uncharacterized protein n=1 Tax=Catharanthus roseus TaxID=4058 RepID=A0ACB9ZYV4_CATRO|nr:hypothetical protein M9H77_29643 [Catharanthus roseus]
MENEGSLGYKLFKTISFLPSTSFFSFDFTSNESNSCSFSFFCNRIQSQFLNFLTTTCGVKSNHGMKAKEEGMGNELSNGFEDTLLNFSLNPFLLYHEFSFKELNLFLELYASYVTLVASVVEFTWLPICGKEMDGSFEKVLKVHLCDFVTTTFENGVVELTLKDLDEKYLEFLDELISLLYCKEELCGLSIEGNGTSNSMDNGMITYEEDALKSKIEDFNGQRKLPKLFVMCLIVKQSIKGTIRSVETTKSLIEVLHEGGYLGKDLDPIL